MSSTDHTCRICRGEATSSQPLYHPCKCRGSIKYIHQDCLMEWLKHSNKSTEKCDICNSPYKFKIIYDPAMPQYIPLDLIWKNFYKSHLQQYSNRFQYHYIYYALLFKCHYFGSSPEECIHGQ